MTITLPTKPPRQLSRPGTNPGIIKSMHCNYVRCSGELELSMKDAAGGSWGTKTAKDAAIQTEYIHVYT